MIRLPFIFILFLIFSAANSQVKAITDNGREVTLYENGTWKYSSDSSNSTENKADTLKISPTKRFRSKAATFLVKSNNINVGIYINTNRWTFSGHHENEVVPEYRFMDKTGGAMAMLVTEKTPFELENMKQVALINAQKAAVDARILSSEYRFVNNKKVLCLELAGTLQRIKFKYLGYYYSNENGTTQLLAFASEPIFNKSRKELEEFLDGFVELPKK
jgi:cellobiose-specific phosphotransferase system component IIB